MTLYWQGIIFRGRDNRTDEGPAPGAVWECLHHHPTSDSARKCAKVKHWSRKWPGRTMPSVRFRSTHDDEVNDWEARLEILRGGPPYADEKPAGEDR